MCFSNDLPVWMTREALSEINQRDNLKKQAKHTSSDDDWKRYRCSRNKVTDIKRDLKRSYFENALNEAGTDRRKLWKLIRQSLGTGKRKSTIDKIYDSTDPSDMANSINQFFVDVAV